MAMLMVCDGCRKVDEPAFRVTLDFNKVMMPGKIEGKTKTMITPKFDLCEGCISRMMKDFGSWQNRWLEERQRGKEEDQTEGTGTGPEGTEGTMPGNPF
jgi:hypothetical protein